MGALVLLAAACGSGDDGAQAGPTTTLHPAPVFSVDDPPGVPRIDAPTKERLQQVVAAGAARGNLPHVFAKVGDSITAIPDFLVPIGCGDVRYGRWGRLRQVVERWSETDVPRGWLDPRCQARNSFTRVGSSTFPGWKVEDLLRAHSPRPAACQPPVATAVRCELSEIRPSLALVMIGTNDMVLEDGKTIDESGLARFEAGFRRLVDEILAAGVVPVVSTVPPRRNPAISAALPVRYNEVIASIAAEKQVPLWDYWAQVQEVQHNGLAYDLVHPSPAPTGAGDLRDDAMNWGFNVRNLGALLALEHVAAVVLDDGPPDA